jgi:hypothetical protein
METITTKKRGGGEEMRGGNETMKQNSCTKKTELIHMRKGLHDLNQHCKIIKHKQE